jgi:hypothetical protein
MPSNIFSLAVTETGGDATAAILLLRIVHWSKYARIKFGDHVWVVKQAIDWMEDTGLTRKQYNRSIAHLRKIGAVVTESHLFKNASHTYARLTAEFKAKIDGLGATPDTPSEHSPVQPSGDNPYSTLETTLELTLDKAHPKTGSQNPLPPSPEVLSGEGKNSEDQHMPKFLHSVEDVISGKLNPKKGANNTTTLNKAIAEWRDRCAEKTGEFQPNFSGKQVGQMKMFVHGTKDPKFKPVERIKDVVTDWVGFTEKVRDLFPHVSKVPSQPTFAFFFEHRHVAYHFTKTTGVTTEVVKTDDGVPAALKGLKVFKGD